MDEEVANALALLLVALRDPATSRQAAALILSTVLVMRWAVLPDAVKDAVNGDRPTRAAAKEKSTC